MAAYCVNEGTVPTSGPTSGRLPPTSADFRDFRDFRPDFLSDFLRLPDFPFAPDFARLRPRLRPDFAPDFAADFADFASDFADFADFLRLPPRLPPTSSVPTSPRISTDLPEGSLWASICR
jgi:hypothetical protein